MSSRSREVYFSYYDPYKIVHEESENGIFEAVWLIKNHKIVSSFSTYHYVIYKALKAALMIKYKGILDLSSIKQCNCKLSYPI